MQDIKKTIYSLYLLGKSIVQIQEELEVEIKFSKGTGLNLLPDLYKGNYKVKFSPKQFEFDFN